MIERILVLIYIFISIGVFIKLKRYGAPNSSILYSGEIPIALFLASTIYVVMSLKKLRISMIKKIKIFILAEIDYLKNISILTGLFCLELGQKKVGLFELYSDGLFKVVYKCVKDIINKFDKMRKIDISYYEGKKLRRI